MHIFSFILSHFIFFSALGGNSVALGGKKVACGCRAKEVQSYSRSGNAKSQVVSGGVGEGRWEGGGA